MAEEYIDGNEVDIDLLLQNGKVKFWSMSDNDATREPFFVETGQCIPSRLSSSQQQELVAMAEEMLERLGVQDGCIHFEAKYGSRGPMPIEINLRMGGDEVYFFVKSAWGVDLIELAAKVMVGQYVKRIAKPDRPKKFLSGKYFLPPYSGVLTGLSLPKKVKDGDLQFFKQVGDAVLAPPVGYEYLGWTFAEADTLGEAEEKVERVMGSVDLEIAKFSRGSSLGRTTRKSGMSAARLSRRAVLGAARIEHIRNLPREKQRNLHVGIASNGFAGSENPIEAELTSDAEAIAATLAERGYRTTFIDFNHPFEAVQQIQDDKIDIVFNLCERINHSALLEPHAASLLDILQVPYTGSNPYTLALCLDKIRVKKLFAFHHIPTPRWDYLYEADEAFDENFPLPAIVKPANSDSSIGITNDSVVASRTALKARIEYVLHEPAGADRRVHRRRRIRRFHPRQHRRPAAHPAAVTLGISQPARGLLEHVPLRGQVPRQRGAQEGHRSAAPAERRIGQAHLVDLGDRAGRPERGRLQRLRPRRSARRQGRQPHRAGGQPQPVDRPDRLRALGSQARRPELRRLPGGDPAPGHSPLSRPAPVLPPADDDAMN
jgi:hypothetical protein